MPSGGSVTPPVPLPFEPMKNATPLLLPTELSSAADGTSTCQTAGGFTSRLATSSAILAGTSPPSSILERQRCILELTQSSWLEPQQALLVNVLHLHLERCAVPQLCMQPITVEPRHPASNCCLQLLPRVPVNRAAVDQLSLVQPDLALDKCVVVRRPDPRSDVRGVDMRRVSGGRVSMVRRRCSARWGC